MKYYVRKHISLEQAIKELRNAYVPGYGYDPDETYYVSFKDGTVIATNEVERKINTKNIIGIEFYGTDAQFIAGRIN